MTKTNFTQVDHRLLQDPNLKVLEVLIYNYIEGWLKTNEKCFVTNGRIAKDLGQKPGMVSAYISRLEEKGLLKRWTHDSTRYLKTLPYKGPVTDGSQKTDHSQKTGNHSQKTDSTVASKLPTTNQKTGATIARKLARYNTSYNTNNNTKNNIPKKEPLLVDNKVKVKNKLVMNKVKRTQWEARYLYGKFDMSGQPGWRDLIDNLSDEELTQFEKYSDSIKPDEFSKDKITEVINQRLFVTQKQT